MGREFWFEEPITITGEWQGWLVRFEGYPQSISSKPGYRDEILSKHKAYLYPSELFATNSDRLWCEVAFSFVNCEFVKKKTHGAICEEIGVRLINHDDINPYGLLPLRHRMARHFPRFLSGVDDCIYIQNINKWYESTLKDKMNLFCDALTIALGNMISPYLIIGRYNGEPIVIIFQNDRLRFNRYWYRPNGIKLYCNENERVKAVEYLITAVECIARDTREDEFKVLTSYYCAMYSLHFDEHRLAFCYLLLESLSKWSKKSFRVDYKTSIIKGILRRHSRKMCGKCVAIISAEIGQHADQLSGEIMDALVHVFPQSSPKYDYRSLMEICKYYRNEVLHGDTMEPMKNTHKKMEIARQSLLANYNNLPVAMVWEAIVIALGARMILGMDYSDFITCYN